MSDEEIGILSISDPSGDRKHFFRRRKTKKDVTPPKDALSSKKDTEEETSLALEPDDIRQARKAFDDKINEGYEAYEYSKPGDINSAKRVYKYNPDAAFITMHPHLSSGK
jgi:hypothetical protein